MAACRKCEGPIFWAWNERDARWFPGDLESIRGDETEFEGGVLLESHHFRHVCGGRGSKPPPLRPKQPPPAPTGPYTVLYVLPNAPKEVVRAAYRALAAIHHPDSGGDSERMIEINRAYATICGER